MEDVLDVKKVVQRPEIIIDDSIDDRILFIEKLQTVRDRLEKHPIPAWIFLSNYSKTQQQDGFCITGVLKYADRDKNTLLLLVIGDEDAQSNYHIRTTPETLNNIIKNYLNKEINVQIRPQINEANQFEYELMAIK